MDSVGGGGAVQKGAERVSGLGRTEREAGAVEDGNAAGQLSLPERRGRPFLVGGAAPIKGGAIAGAGAESVLVEDLSTGALGDASQQPNVPLATVSKVGGYLPSMHTPRDS